MKDNIHNTTVCKVNGQLIIKSEAKLNLFNLFLESLEEGQEVNVFYEACNSDGTNIQLAKIHVLIKKLAVTTGTTVNDLKLEIKNRCGLVSEEHIKSFAQCSKDELGLVLEELKTICNYFHISFDL